MLMYEDAETVEWLSKKTDADDAGPKRIFCTGETMKDTVLEAFTGLQQTAFYPEHTVRLDNKYACFADFGFS